MSTIETPVVIVTGASRGLGAAIAQWLAVSRTAVVLVARSKGPLQDVAAIVERRGGRVLTVTADLADPDSCREVIEKAIAHFGRLDALVNNAGTIEPIASIADGDPAAWRANLAINLLAPFDLTRAAIPHLRDRHGRVVNVSSGAAVLTIHGASAYCAAKAALNHFTRVLAEEEPAITSMCVRPGVVDTDMQRVIRARGPGVMPAQRVVYYRDLKESGKLEAPEIPGRAIAWLALHGPREYNGEFLTYDDPKVAAAATEFFGDVSVFQPPDKSDRGLKSHRREKR